MCAIRDHIKTCAILTWKNPVTSGAALAVSSAVLLAKIFDFRCTGCCSSCFASPLDLWNMLYSLVFGLFVLGAMIKAEKMFLAAECACCAAFREKTGYTKPVFRRTLLCCVLLVRAQESNVMSYVLQTLMTMKAAAAVRLNQAKCAAFCFFRNVVTPVLRFDSVLCSLKAYVLLAIVFRATPCLVSLFLSMLFPVLLIAVWAAFAYGKFHACADKKIEALAPQLTKLSAKKDELKVKAVAAQEKAVVKASEVAAKAAVVCEKVQPKVIAVASKVCAIVEKVTPIVKNVAAKICAAAKPHFEKLQNSKAYKTYVTPLLARFDEEVKPAFGLLQQTFNQTILSDDMADFCEYLKSPTKKMISSPVQTIIADKEFDSVVADTHILAQPRLSKIEPTKVESAAEEEATTESADPTRYHWESQADEAEDSETAAPEEEAMDQSMVSNESSDSPGARQRKFQ